MRDAIEIHDLEIPLRIGITAEERAEPQNLYLDLLLSADTRMAGETDDLEDTVDYFALSEQIRSFASASEFQLIEKFAEEIARICIQDFSAPSVSVKVKKPGALSAARTIAVTIQRDTADYPPDSDS